MNAFRRILRALRIAAGETQARFQISAAQLFVLEELNAAGRPLSINELAETTMTDRSSVADVVERLAQGGYVSRGRSSADRRRAEVSITVAGSRLARSAPPAPTLLIIAGLRDLPRAELRSLAHGLEHLADAMGLGGQRPHFLFEDETNHKNRPRKPRKPAARGRR